MKNLTGLEALTTPDELAEVRVVGRKPTLKLQYLKNSKKLMGMALWNVLSPVAGYKTGPMQGVPTFSLIGLKEHGLI